MQCLFQNRDPNVWATLSVLHVSFVGLEFWEGFVRMVSDNKLPNLKELSLWFPHTDIDISLPKIQADKLPSLKCLYLFGFNHLGEPFGRRSSGSGTEIGKMGS